MPMKKKRSMLFDPESLRAYRTSFYSNKEEKVVTSSMAVESNKADVFRSIPMLRE